MAATTNVHVLMPPLASTDVLIGRVWHLCPFDEDIIFNAIYNHTVYVYLYSLFGDFL